MRLCPPAPPSVSHSVLSHVGCCCVIIIYLLTVCSLHLTRKKRDGRMEVAVRVGIPFAIFIAVQLVDIAYSGEVKRLRNQPCMPRKTLIHVKERNGAYLYPFVVSLYRCGGSCLNVPPNQRTCVSQKFEKIPVQMRNMKTKRMQIIYMTNDTSCACPCSINESSCNARTQFFDKKSCRCECSRDARRFSWSCKAPFQWDASSCKCECSLHCNHLQTLDKESCRCKCKLEVYEECRLMGKYVKGDSCRCVSLNEIQKSSGKTSCDEFPTKWLAILIFMGFFMFLILAFDCALYGKKTGLSYKLLHCCRRRKRHEAEEMSAGRMLTERG